IDSTIPIQVAPDFSPGIAKPKKIRTSVQYPRIREARLSLCDKSEEIGLKSEEYLLILHLSPRVETRGN
ncbi:MAG TPA: hypothetical protein VN367_08485, partial [Chlorobaculum sp.]|nr:hypothetical protein [Chlorobaculum sp.]